MWCQDGAASPHLAILKDGHTDDRLPTLWTAEHPRVPEEVGGGAEPNTRSCGPCSWLAEGLHVRPHPHGQRACWDQPLLCLPQGNPGPAYRRGGPSVAPCCSADMMGMVCPPPGLLFPLHTSFRSLLTSHLKWAHLPPGQSYFFFYCSEIYIT